MSVNICVDFQNQNTDNLSNLCLPVGGSSQKKKNVHWRCLRVAVFRQRGRDSSRGTASHEKSEGEGKKNSLAKEKKNQRIGIIGIIQGGWAQSGGVSALGESFRHPQRETVCTISHANSDPCSE